MGIVYGGGSFFKIDMARENAGALMNKQIRQTHSTFPHLGL